MRAQRAALFIGWVLVSLLAVAGFAAFSPGDDGAVPASPLIAEGLGRSSGAVAAVEFTYLTASDSRPLTTTTTEAPATTEATADADSDAVVVRTSVMSESDVRVLIETYFEPDDVNRAVRVAWCESNFNPISVNPATGAAGLFQHLPGLWEERSSAAGWTGANIFDPEANVAVAAWLLYENPGGWTHWECQP